MDKFLVLAVLGVGLGCAGDTGPVCLYGDEEQPESVTALECPPGHIAGCPGWTAYCLPSGEPSYRQPTATDDNDLYAGIMCDDSYARCVGDGGTGDAPAVCIPHSCDD